MGDSTEEAELRLPSAPRDLRVSLLDHVDYFFQLRDRGLRAAYDDFNSHNQSLKPTFAWNAFISILVLSMALNLGFKLGSEGLTLNNSSWVGSCVFMVATNISQWVYYWEYRNIHLTECMRNNRVLNGRMRSWQVALFLALSLMTNTRLILKVVHGECSNPYYTYGTVDCNPADPFQALPPDAAFLSFLVPVIHSLLVRGAQLRTSSCLALMSDASLIGCSIYMGARNSAIFVLVAVFSSKFILVESAKQNLLMFFMYQKLEQQVRLKEQAVDEANASEMRHMIANVAHDLKTPLASFLGGIDYIAEVIKDISTKTATPGFELEEGLSDLSGCIVNMRNTNAFMLMTINRCIDYTKASKGVALVPKYETIDLLETLTLPMHCMKDIQQRIAISLQPLPTDICSHVITDKQWLQENVLCLLSNAVKYSNEGAVTVVAKLVGVEVPVSTTSGVAKLSKSSSFSSLLKAHVDEMFSRYTNAPKDTEVQQHLVIEVEDTGIGLSDEAMASLFSPFKQAQRLAGGTGLGLFSLAKRIEALSGRCGVERRRDGSEGSLFWFSIPYRPDAPSFVSHRRGSRLGRSSSHMVVPLQDDELTTAGMEDVVSVAVIRPQCSQGSDEGKVDYIPRRSDSSQTLGDNAPEPALDEDLDVLVVDDSPAILKMTAMILRRCKYRVTTAINGAEALKVIGEHLEQTGRPFDVVLMDLQMPVMDGLEATRRLRALEEADLLLQEAGSTRTLTSTPSLRPLLPSLPGSSPPGRPRSCIIGVSANSDIETAAEAYRMGVDAFMPKPFSMETFRATYKQTVLSRS